MRPLFSFRTPISQACRSNAASWRTDLPVLSLSLSLTFGNCRFASTCCDLRFGHHNPSKIRRIWDALEKHGKPLLIKSKTPNDV